MGIVRPRKLLYMAIDGVAPRAKMNQQRSRRFRAAREAKEKEERELEENDRLRDEGKEDLIKKKDGMVFDSNVITPGTLFMAKVADGLQQYIFERMRDNPSWQSVFILFFPLFILFIHSYSFYSSYSSYSFYSFYSFIPIHSIQLIHLIHSIHSIHLIHLIHFYSIEVNFNMGFY